jgi:hypothetical protein
MVRAPELFIIPLPNLLLARHLALQTEGENRSRPRVFERVCEKSTLTVIQECEG